MDPKKPITLNDIKFVLNEDDGKGGKKPRELTKEEVFMLVPKEPKENLMEKLKKKSENLGKKLRNAKNASPERIAKKSSG